MTLEAIIKEAMRLAVDQTGKWTLDEEVDLGRALNSLVCLMATRHKFQVVAGCNDVDTRVIWVSRSA